jgi:hypothetical protein
VANFSPQASLAQVRTWLRSKVDEGVECPACRQHVKVYRRKINSGMARSLMLMYRVGGRDWVHVPSQVGARSREEGKLAYWGLVEEEKALRPDGGRTGYWRVTRIGELFVLNKCTVPKYARIYNGELVNLDPNEQVSIVDALGTKFDYAEMMAGV